MTLDEFALQSTQSKTMIILTEGNIEYLYYMLSRLTKRSIAELKKLYTISMRKVKKDFTINGEYDDIAKLFMILQSRDITPISISFDSLRIDIPNFMNKFN